LEFSPPNSLFTISRDARRELVLNLMYRKEASPKNNLHEKGKSMEPKLAEQARFFRASAHIVKGFSHHLEFFRQWKTGERKKVLPRG